MIFIRSSFSYKLLTCSPYPGLLVCHCEVRTLSDVIRRWLCMTMWSAGCAVSTLLNKIYYVCKCGVPVCGSKLPPGGLDGLSGKPRVSRIDAFFKCRGLLVMQKVSLKLFPRYLSAPMKSMLLNMCLCSRDRRYVA